MHLSIPLDTNGQFKLQVYADGFAPSIRKFDEFKTTNIVRMARAVGCKMPALSRRPVSLHEYSTGRRLTSLEGGNRGMLQCGQY